MCYLKVLSKRAKKGIHQLTGEVIQKLTSEVKVLSALRKEPEQRKQRQHRIAASVSVTCNCSASCRITSG